MSSYQVGQKRWAGGLDTQGIFLTELQSDDFIASRISTYIDSGTNISDAANIGFYDECLLYNDGNTFKANTTYYFHGRIMRLPSDQVFNIILRPLNATGVTDKTLQQYVKKIVVKKRKTTKYNDWADIHFTFTPVVSSFDALVFQLSRSAAAGDLDANTVRYPCIIYEELSVVGNYMSESDKYVKAGIQTHPGLEMCVNGEEINVGRSGTYEVRNGLLTINSFSILSPSEEYDPDNTTDGVVETNSGEPYFEEFTYIINPRTESTGLAATAYGGDTTAEGSLKIYSSSSAWKSLYGNWSRDDVAAATQTWSDDYGVSDDGDTVTYPFEDVYPVVMDAKEIPQTPIEKVQYRKAKAYWGTDFYYRLAMAFKSEMNAANLRANSSDIDHVEELEYEVVKNTINRVKQSYAYTVGNTEVVNASVFATEEEGIASPTSECRIGSTFNNKTLYKQRNVDAFVLDYMYERE